MVQDTKKKKKTHSDMCCLFHPECQLWQISGKWSLEDTISPVALVRKTALA